jgi:hypothetical protein
VTRVARAFSTPPAAVLGWPWHEVLLAWFGLEEVERIDRLADEVDVLRAAFLGNYAVNDPKKLMVEQRALAARLRAAADREHVDEGELMANAIAFAAIVKTNTEGAS